jgi:hypothetical protein
MPTAANITIKKFDGVTDIVWTLLSASGGDASPAIWRSETATGTKGQRPLFSMVSRWNGPKTARRLDWTMTYPSVYTDSSSSLTQVRDTSVMTGSCVMPTGSADTDLNEAGAQFPNLLASALIKSALIAGFAPV